MSIYHIEVKGRLPSDIHLRFEGVIASENECGNTRIVCLVRDQSMLLGILNWLRTLNCELLSVYIKNDGEEPEPQLPS